jgi:hypothetical protein
MMQAARVVSSNSSSGLCGIGPQNEIGKRGAPRPAEERGRCAAEKSEARAAYRLQLPVRHVVVYDLLGDAVGKLNGEFVGVNCPDGAVAEHRV